MTKALGKHFRSFRFGPLRPPDDDGFISWEEEEEEEGERGGEKKKKCWRNIEYGSGLEKEEGMSRKRRGGCKRRERRAGLVVLT